MSDLWILLAWLVGTLLFLVILERWLNRHLQGLILLITRNPEIVMYFNFLLLLPGIVLHELSHWVSARLLGVSTRGISILPRKRRGQQILYGSVQIGSADSIRYSLIGLAPLATGSMAVLLCAWLGLGVAPLSVPESVGQIVTYFHAPDAPLWIYLIFAISNAMLPSASDRQPWRPVILFLGFVSALLVVTGVLSRVPAGITKAAFYAVAYLAYAFTLTIAVDLLFVLAVFVLENGITYLSGRRVQY